MNADGDEVDPEVTATSPTATPSQTQPSTSNNHQAGTKPSATVLKESLADREQQTIQIGDPLPNNNSRKTMNHNMSNENNADASSIAIGAPSRGGGGQPIGINGASGPHSYHSQNQTGHFGNNNSVGHHLRSTESDEEDFSGGGGGDRVSGPSGQYGGSSWGAVRSNSRAVSPSLIDNMSENSSQAAMPGQMVRSKSRPEIIGPSSRYNNTSFWKARRVLFYRNGDPFFAGIEYRFKPTRDISTLEALLEKLTPKMDLPRGARYVFSMDGDRKYSLDELEDGASYVLSSFKVFKVSAV